MTRTELLNRMSSREITEWMAFGQLEPFGAEASYVGHAITSKTVAEVGTNKPHKILDFMPSMGKKEPQTQEQMIQFAEMYTIALGGKDLRDKEE